MTNREWLNTLTDEQFAEWAVINNPMPFTIEKICGGFKITEIPDKLYPRLQEIKANSTSSFYALIEWLKKEHFDWAKAEISVEE